jgi:hypothetical protein
MSGQIAGMIHDLPTVKEVIESIVTGSDVVSQRLADELASIRR